MIKAIETVYNGYRFRSRLEARWAVFFHACGRHYQYEPQGFEQDGTWYLPDFWVGRIGVNPLDENDMWKDWGLWVEIKPGPATDEEIAKLMLVCKGTHHNGLMIQGTPWPGEFTCTKLQIMHYEEPFLVFDWPYVGMGVSEVDQPAFEAARQARFEYGECG